MHALSPPNKETHMENHADNINRLFSIIELQGVDTQQPMLYGYFFIDKAHENLERIKTQLVRDGYTFVDLGKSEDARFLLHVENVVIHSRESLFKQIQDFEQLAKTHHVESFDGWDLGNPDKSKALINHEDFEKQLQGKTAQELFDYGDKLLHAGVFSKAVAVFDRCLADGFDVEQCLYKQFICHDCLENLPQAIASLEKILALNPKNFKACFNMGAIAYDQKDYKTAIQFYEQAAKIHDNNEFVYYGIALAQYGLNYIEEAAKNCKIALQLNPHNAQTKELLGMIENTQ